MIRLHARPLPPFLPSVRWTLMKTEKERQFADGGGGGGGRGGRGAESYQESLVL
jgi:hypothetical protein